MNSNLIPDLEPFAAVSLDAVAWDPGLVSSLHDDLLRLGGLIAARGKSVTMIDLPEGCKVLDSALSSGWMDYRKLPKTFGSSKDPSKILFSCLWEKIFDENGLIRQDPDINHVFFLRQFLTLAKKVREDCSETAIHVAVQDFTRIEAEARSPTLWWDSDDLCDHHDLGLLSWLDGYRGSGDWFSDREPTPKGLINLFGRVTDSIVVGFGELDPYSLRPRHGPGAVADARSGTDKYLFPYWPRKLDQLFPFEYFTQSRDDLHLELSVRVSPHEPPARLLAVPKDLKGPRLIASEPIAHQYIQQALMRWIRENLPKPLALCINFLDQEPSRQSALRASESGQQATVDLSSASDRLTCWVVERAFRKHPVMLRALHASRTRTVKNCTGVGEEFYLRLKKFAAMGSATTFPVQSIVYACVAIASVLFEEGRRPTYSNICRAARQVRVFGDDIVMPSLAVRNLDQLMTYLGLKLNMRKTHVSGHFRESCGMDAYKGYDVTPIHPELLELGTAPNDLVAWIDIVNNAYLKGLWHFSSWMLSQVPLKKRELIPVSRESLGCITLRTHQDVLVSQRCRVNSSLHRQEVLGFQDTSRTDRRRRDTYASLLQYFLEEPDPEIKWSSGFNVRNRSLLRKRWVPIYREVER